MLEEGNQTILSRDPDYYNVQKFTMMHRILSGFLGNRSRPKFETKLEPLHTFLTVLPHHSENGLYSLVKQVQEAS